MQESYRKGVATHPDPESCVASRKATAEALTGAHVGRAADQGGHRAADTAPATEPGQRDERSARCAESRTTGQAGTVHGAAPPRNGCSASGEFLRAQARLRLASMAQRSASMRRT